MTTHETISYKGCTINVHQDESPENPFESWDCEPPLLTYYGGRHGYFKTYCDAPDSWWDILRLLPDSCFQRGKRVEFIKEHLDCSIREFAEERRRNGDIDTIAEMLGDKYGSVPSGWRAAMEWMEAAQSILAFGGITAVYDQSNGYCQGDSTLCLAIATPAWIKLTGAPESSHKRQLEGAIELYGSWAWGDVYGFTLEDESGEEIEGSVWGFYGSDHKESGLLEHAESYIDSHLESQAKESERLESALCSFA